MSSFSQSNQVADPRCRPSYHLKSAFEQNCPKATPQRPTKPRTCDGKICGPYDTRLCPQKGYGNQPYPGQGYGSQAYSQQGYANQPRYSDDDFCQEEEEEEYPMTGAFAANSYESVCDESAPPNYWSGLKRAPEGSTIDELRKNVWCSTPMTEYMATHGDLASKILTEKIPLKRDVLGEPPCNVCENVMPPCRGYFQQPECVDYCLDMSCNGPMPNRDKVSRYWNPCLANNCDNSDLAFPASGLLAKLRKRNA